MYHVFASQILVAIKDSADISRHEKEVNGITFRYVFCIQGFNITSTRGTTIWWQRNEASFWYSDSVYEDHNNVFMFILNQMFSPYNDKTISLRAIGLKHVNLTIQSHRCSHVWVWNIYFLLITVISLYVTYIEFLIPTYCNYLVLITTLPDWHSKTGWINPIAIPCNGKRSKVKYIYV